MNNREQTLPHSSNKAGPQELEKKFMYLWRDQAGRLMCKTGEEDAVGVHLRPCFPWTAPKEYLSLRDDANREIVLIDNIDQLANKNREAIEAALADVRFTFNVISILSIEKDFQLNVWKVRTEQGDRIFQTKVDNWPVSMEDGSIIISDLSNDLYRISDPENLDKKSARLLWAYREG